MYLITGATGNIGREVVHALRAAGRPVRAVSRDARAPDLDGVRPVTGDLNRPETLRPALEGVEGLFLLPGYAAERELLALAEAAGVARVVLLSGSSAAGDPSTNAVTRYMAASEAAVRDSGLAATIIRPSMFMSNTFDWLPQLRAGDLVRAPFAHVAAAVLDPADIGAVVAVALTSPGPDGEVHRITGPRALRPADRVAVLAEVLGRPLRFAAQPDDEARAEMAARMPGEYVDAFFDFYVRGSLDESPVLPTVERLLGRPPRSFADWARAHLPELR